MFNPKLENELIVVDIVDAMQDWCSIQIDIDSTKVKAAAIVAQRIDLKRVLKGDLERCKDPQTEADEQLRDIIVPALCYYTYYRCLTMFQGTLTDSGFVIEGESVDRNAAKSTANEIKAIAEVFINEAITFLREENPDTDVTNENLVSSIRVFGGEENRASN